jgi:hypothetical protein
MGTENLNPGLPLTCDKNCAVVLARSTGNEQIIFPDSLFCLAYGKVTNNEGPFRIYLYLY